MIVALPYSHQDINQAHKLIHWIGFLSEQNGFSMQNETLLLVPSQMAWQRAKSREIRESAEAIFRDVFVHVPEKDDERGWPQACNAMFAEALQWVEQHAGDNVMFMEPDAIPQTPPWYDIIQDEYAQCGKPFYGGLVPIGETHMTGIAVYGRGWRAIAPTLIVNTKWPWDVYSAREVVAHNLAHFTRRIQHVNRQPQLSKLSNVWPEAVIYHQDKVGALIDELDATVYGGAFSRHPLFQRTNDPVFMPMRFYAAENVMRPKTHAGFKFQFEQVGIFGGTSMGVYAADDEAAIIALNALASNPATTVREISAQEYEELSKKKAPKPRLTVCAVSNPKPPEFPAMPINPTMGHITGPKALVVEENPLPSPSVQSPTSGPVVEDIKSVLKLGTISPNIRDASKPKRGRPAGKK